ncbi:hypothetical protein [Candidatus Lokiarchaeum ossiferum]|uniref:hypothetical protein n=1 Tax=Candidatus Lokiarchaeum ossiferum TaxID=2951803 RepID=UPI00352CB5D2
MFPKSEMEAINNYRHYSIRREISVNFPDITEKFWLFLANQKNDPESCYMCVIFGMRRIGKTALSFSKINVLMENDPTRKLCLFKCPDSLFNEIVKIFPGRVYSAQNLMQVENDSILYIDEALLELNAKLATTKDLRNFGQSLVKTSHKRIITIVCAQDDGFMKDLRKKADLIIYKRLTTGFVDETENKFIKKKENREILLELPIEKAIVYSNYYFYNEKIKLRGKTVFTGMIDIDLKKHCHWWSKKISRNMSNSSMDRDYEESIKNIGLIREVSQKMIDVYGKKRLKKSKTQRLIKGFYLENDMKKHREVQNLLSHIEDYIEFLCTEQLTEEDKESEEDRKYQLPPEIINEGMTFGQYVQVKLPNSNGKIMFLLLSGWKQDEIADKMQMNKADVSEIIHSYSETQIGYWLEEWFALRMGGGPTGGYSNAPDYIDATGRVFSLKYRYSRAHSQTFFQESQKPWLKPEHDYCVGNLIESYFLVYYNPQWRKKALKIIEVKAFGDDKVLVKIDDPSKIELENFF